MKIEPAVGWVYHVKAEDCCVNVRFTSKLISIRYEDDDVKREYPEYAFKNGVIIHGLKVEFTIAEDQT